MEIDRWDGLVHAGINEIDVPSPYNGLKDRLQLGQYKSHHVTTPEPTYALTNATTLTNADQSIL